MPKWLEAFQFHPPGRPRRARDYHDEQPHWSDPEPPIDLAHWVLAELGIEVTLASLLLATYFTAFFELDKPRGGPQWNEDGTRLGIQHGRGRKARFFQLGQVRDPRFWTDALPDVAEAYQVASPACLFVHSTHIWYHGLYHIGVRHDRHAEKGHSLLVCRYTHRTGWQHRGPQDGIRPDSLVLALARGVVDPSRALATQRQASTKRATGYVGPGGHQVITSRDCRECNARPTATIGAAGCAWPTNWITPP